MFLLVIYVLLVPTQTLKNNSVGNNHNIEDIRCRPDDAYVGQCIMSIMVQVTVCRLFYAKPSSNPTMVNSQFHFMNKKW